jgi:superfamily II DNA or RNA helicase
MSIADRVWAGAPVPPRAWQHAAIEPVFRELAANRRTVVSAVPGSGKSELIGCLVRSAVEKAAGTTDVVVVCTPTRKLVQQLARTIGRWVGPEHVGRFFSDAKEPDRRVVVTCNPSLSALVDALQGRACRFLLVDECHRSETEQVRDVAPRLAPKRIVGFTATPFRGLEGEGLSMFESVAVRYPLSQALRDGVLVPWRVVNYDGEGSDDTDDVCEAMIREHGIGPGVVSAQSIPDAEAYAERLTSRGIRALAIHSELGTREQDFRVERLLAGDLRCLVHVAMLVEGVDLPPLRWLCLRRPTGSAIRFVQEIGRVLRVHPGKTYATLMDPHDLFGSLGLAHPERVGDAAAILEQAMERESRSGSGSPGPVPEMPRAVAVDRLSRWARQVSLGLYAAGLAEAPVKSRSWRSGYPTDRQLSALRNLLWAARYLPEPSRSAVKTAAAIAPELTAGGVGDLITVLKSLANASGPARAAKRHYHLPQHVELPDLDAAVLSAALPRKAA